MRIYFRVPHPHDLNFEADLPGIPRPGDMVDSEHHGVFYVEAITWFLDEEDSNPYVVLTKKGGF